MKRIMKADSLDSRYRLLDQGVERGVSEKILRKGTENEQLWIDGGTTRVVKTREREDLRWIDICFTA